MSMSEAELSMDLELAETDYRAGDPITLTARLTVRNWAADPSALTFPTSQSYDLEIRDDQGKVVYVWSRGQVFSQIMTELQIQYEKDYAINATVGKLAPGKYIAQAWLTADGPPRAYSASARFHVT